MCNSEFHVFATAFWHGVHDMIYPNYTKEWWGLNWTVTSTQSKQHAEMAILGNVQ